MGLGMSHIWISVLALSFTIYVTGASVSTSV